jgi:Na+/H+ antiporter NhaD/arsenite permease-like protein
MLGFDVLTFDEAMQAIDHRTLVLLLGMMIVVANLRLSGFFRLVSAWVVRHAHRPLTLLAAIVLVSGVFSAFFVNDTMCLVLTPLVLEVAAALGRNPVPYLLAVAMASNAGSAPPSPATPEHDEREPPYLDFASALAPPAAGALLIVSVVITLLYRHEFRDPRRVEVKPLRVRVNRVLMTRAFWLRPP